MKFNFVDKKNTMVLTTKKIVNKEHDILIVSHDEEDGMWEFLDNEVVSEEDAMIVSLMEIFTIDSSIGLIADLPIGWIAYRDDIQAQWIRYDSRDQSETRI